MELSETELHVEEGKTAKDEHGEVGDQERSAPIGVAHIRKP